MAGISSATINRIRQRVLGYLNDTCDIERETATTDDYGYPVKTWATVDSGVACRMLPNAGRDSKGMVAGLEEGRVYFRLIVPHDTTVEDGDRVNLDGVIYEIVQVDDAWSQKAFKALVVVRFG